MKHLYFIFIPIIFLDVAGASWLQDIRELLGVASANSLPLDRVRVGGPRKAQVVHKYRHIKHDETLSAPAPAPAAAVPPPCKMSAPICLAPPAPVRGISIPGMPAPPPPPPPPKITPSSPSKALPPKNSSGGMEAKQAACSKFSFDLRYGDSLIVEPVQPRILGGSSGDGTHFGFVLILVHGPLLAVCVCLVAKAKADTKLRADSAAAMATAARERADLQVATARKEAATSVIEAQEQAASAIAAIKRETIAEPAAVQKQAAKDGERVAAELAIKVAELAAKDIEMTTKDIEIAAKDAELAAKDAELAAKDAELAAKDAELAAKNAELTAAELAAAESQAVLAQALAMLTNNQKTLSKPAEKELDATNITSDEHTLATTSDDGKDYLATADGELSVTEPAKGSGRKTRRGCRGKRLSKRQNNALASEEAGGPSGNGDGGS